MRTPNHVRARAAQQSAAIVLILALVGLSIDAMSWEVSVGHAPPLHLVGVVVAIALLLALGLRKNKSSVRFGALVSLLNTVFVLAALWMADDVLARGPRPWVPFQPQKLGAFAIALLAPEPAWLGVVLIVAFTAAPVCQFLLFSPEVRAHLAVGEPWATIAFGAFALVLLFDRHRRMRLERAAAVAQAEADSLNHIARVSLAVRDLSNTPLQTIRIGTALLRARHPEEKPAIERMEHAVCRLEELSRALSRYEARVEWIPEAESFDPIAVVEGLEPASQDTPHAKPPRSSSGEMRR